MTAQTAVASPFRGSHATSSGHVMICAARPSLQAPSSVTDSGEEPARRQYRHSLEGAERLQVPRVTADDDISLGLKRALKNPIVGRVISEAVNSLRRHNHHGKGAKLIQQHRHLLRFPVELPAQHLRKLTQDGVREHQQHLLPAAEVHDGPRHAGR